jgi:adenosylcobinamide-GDP ribazoletransferase
VIPVGGGVPPDPSCTRWFPLVGAGIGVGVAAVIVGGLLALPTLPPLVAAALALALWSVLPGGLHEDAWCDVADAALAPVPRERRLEILRDPRVGAHGASALVLVLLLRLAGLVGAGSLVTAGAAAGVVPGVPGGVLGVAAAVALSPVVGRWVMVLSLRHAAPLRREGLAAAFAGGARSLGASVVALVLVAGAVTGAGLPVGVALGSVLGGLASGFLVVALVQGRMGGLSGDGHGAAGYAAESGALLAAVLLLHALHGMGGS